MNTPVRGNLLVLMTLAIGFVMAMIDLTAVNVALSGISISLSVPLTGLVWVVDGYTLTFAALLLAGGALADRFGPKTIYQAGLALFIGASVLCGIAWDGDSLIAARFLQGAGAALFMPSSLSLLAFAYQDAATRIRMLGIWSALVGASSAIGPLIGGFLIHEFGWRSVFWINVPIGLAGIMLAQALLAAPPKQPRALSLASHALGVLMLSALTFFLIEGPARGWFSAEVVSALLIGIASVTALVWRERTGAHPLVPHALFEIRGFVAVNLTGFLINFAAFGQFFLMGLYLQQARASDPFEAGLQLLPMMAAITVGNLLSGRLSARRGTRATMVCGLTVAALAGLVMLNFRESSPYLVLALVAGLMNFAAGVAIPAMTTTVMQLSGKSYANSAAAALNANRQIGALVGVATVGTILHVLPLWSARLLAAFAVITLAYAAAAWLVWRFAPSPTAPGAAP
ncbi:MFS transporter [Neorhizobium lilium]|uniref:MFS transporter n=1 Tax=Neorhizobium lilium TaxID=2503024 RepID=A0A444LAU3_9HYPH|nr:MFS transporter [Neorhizobium lilium]RWX74699.1 MFS transporter [Neorhizobium lilium]